MELTLEELPSMAEQFEKDIPDDCMVINVKYNFEIEDEYTADDAMNNVPFYEFAKYVRDLGCEILFSSAGYHLNGDNKQPHLHYNFITTQFFPPSNPSQHRKRWAKKSDASLEFLHASWKFHHKIDKTTPKYSVLSYPLKEGHDIKHHRKSIYLYDTLPMTKEQIQFLKDVGKGIYDKELGLKLRQDKSEERKKNALLGLYGLCLDNKEKFSTYRNMVVWLDTAYIEPLEIEEYPESKNYKSNCEKIAVKLKKLKYSDII